MDWARVRLTFRASCGRGVPGGPGRSSARTSPPTPSSPPSYSSSARRPRPRRRQDRGRGRCRPRCRPTRPARGGRRARPGRRRPPRQSPPRGRRRRWSCCPRRWRRGAGGGWLRLSRTSGTSQVLAVTWVPREQSNVSPYLTVMVASCSTKVMTSDLVFDLVLAVPPALIRVGLRRGDRGTPAHVLKRIRVVEGFDCPS